MPRKKGRTAMVNVQTTLTREYYAELLKYSALLGYTIADSLRDAVYDWLEKVKPHLQKTGEKEKQ